MLVTTLAGLDTGVEERPDSYKDGAEKPAGIEQSDRKDPADGNSKKEGVLEVNDKTYLHPTDKPSPSAGFENENASSIHIDPSLRQADQLQRIQKPSVECKVTYPKSEVKADING